LDELVPSWAAVVISVTAVLICGEVLPTALFTGPNQLQIAAKFSSLAYFLEFIFYPIAYPMSLALDRVLGVEDEENLSRNELSAMMRILRENKTNEAAKLQLKHSRDLDNDSEDSSHNPMNNRDSDSVEEDPLSHNEVNVITGVLALAKKSIRDIYMGIDKVNMLSSDLVLNMETMEAIDRVGHSRLPVYQGTNNSHIIGFLLVKRLISVNPEQNIPLGDIKLIQPIAIG
jgi:metal transporter CNNM